MGIRILAVAFVTSGLGIAAPNSSQHPSLFDSTWVLADFNGDRQPDFASARPAHHDGRGYAHEISISLGSGHTSFRFHSPAANIELSVRDIDGDEDRDIIVLEARSKQPVSVWLNDGAGSFEEGDLARFQKSIGDSSGPRLRMPSSPFVLHAVVEQRVPTSLSAFDFESRDRELELLPFPSDSPARHRSASNLRTRAPPRF